MMVVVPAINGQQSTIFASDIEREYDRLLEETLVPPAVRARLLETQTVDKKIAFLSIHRESRARCLQSSVWGERDRALLAGIFSSGGRHVTALVSLKVLLSSANKTVLASFLQDRGLEALLHCLLCRTQLRQLNESESATLYEALLCCKLVMNNGLGMQAFLEVTGSIDAIALSLRFEHKHLALLVRLLSLSLSLSLAYVHCFSLLYPRNCPSQC
jgi:hypothetical protein